MLAIIIMKRILFFTVNILIACSCTSSGEKNTPKTSADNNSRIQFEEKVSEVENLDLAHKFILELIELGELKRSNRLDLEAELIDAQIFDDLMFSETELSEVESDNEISYSKIDTNERGELTIQIDTSSLQLEFSGYVSMYPKIDLSKTEIEELKLQIPLSRDKKFNNSILSFNPKNENNWYRLSYPIFTKDGNHVILKVSDLCKGLCGHGQILLYSKNQNNSWKKEIIQSWWH